VLQEEEEEEEEEEALRDCLLSLGHLALNATNSFRE
jgi:hypothetical protein